MENNCRMRILVIGASGQLGNDVVRYAASKGHAVIGTSNSTVTNPSYFKLDITDREATLDFIKDMEPNVIIHCAAWTSVDAAESPENKNIVDLVNRVGTENVAEGARLVDAKLVYISTDYVFNGQGSEPWKADDTNFGPLNVYGQSKLNGEFAVKRILDRYFIIRISWVFGIRGSNFIKTMIKVGKTNDKVRVVNDQIGLPTYTVDLAKLIIDMIQTENYGVYHATNTGEFISWYDFCVEIYKQCGLSTKVIPVTTQEYGMTPAVRPHNSRLDLSKLVDNGFELLPDWRDAVRRYLKEANLWAK